VDTVVADAVGERLPGAPALRETLRRRRATGGPAEQTFATLIGLELRPRRLRAAAELWAAVGESRGTDGRDALWADPGLLPSPTDLDDPAGFVDRDKKFAELLAGLDDLDTSIFEDAPGEHSPGEDGPGEESAAPGTEPADPPRPADGPDDGDGAGPSAPRPV
jgi:hypothetical protein